MVNRVEIQPGLLRWAIEESQLPFDEVKEKFPSIDAWIGKSLDPTYNQVKKLADFLHVPFGYLFLDEPPEKDILLAEFRAIANKKPMMSKNLEDTLLEMTLKQNWMREYRKNQDNEPLEFVGKYPDANPEDVKHFIYNTLSIRNYWSENAKTYGDAFAILKRQLGELGVLIMQSGTVNANTHRKLDIHEFRGFMLLDPFAPLIFINSNDSRAGMIFTIMHEFIHILIGDEDIFDTDDEFSHSGMEKVINHITSTILIPDDVLVKYDFSTDHFLQTLDEVAKKLKVSTLSLAVRLKQKRQISQAQLDEVRTQSIENFEKFASLEKKGNPDFFRVQNSKLSPFFSEAVINQSLTGEIPFTEAYRLLGVKGTSFEKFKEYFFKYA